MQGGKREYVVDCVLGKGGFGVTYRVIGHVDVDNIDFDAPFAVKEFFPDICSRETDNATIKVPETKQAEVTNGLKDFVNEAHRLQDTCKLNHNIVNVNEVFQANGTAYYVLEYLGGGDLRKMVDESPNKALTEQQMLELMLPVGRAVQCLHENHILHLDIKPDNIVMRKGRKGAADEPVLIDFGLATHFNSSGAPTSMTPSQGISAGYSPIEQYSLLRQFDPRLDVYAFSATCLYLLTGKDPAEALSMPAVFDESIIPATVSDHVRQAIKHGMSKEKDLRTPSMKQLLAELQPEQDDATPPIKVESTQEVDENKTVKVHRQEQKKKHAATEQNQSLERPQEKEEDNKSKKQTVYLYIFLAFLAALIIILIVLFSSGVGCSRNEQQGNDSTSTYVSNDSFYNIDETEPVSVPAEAAAEPDAVSKPAIDDYSASAPSAAYIDDYPASAPSDFYYETPK